MDDPREALGKKTAPAAGSPANRAEAEIPSPPRPRSGFHVEEDLGATEPEFVISNPLPQGADPAEPARPPPPPRAGSVREGPRPSSGLREPIEPPARPSSGMRLIEPLPLPSSRERERIEPPTQPIDITGFQETPLPPASLEQAQRARALPQRPGSVAGKERVPPPRTSPSGIQRPPPPSTPAGRPASPPEPPSTPAEAAANASPSALKVALPASVLIVDDDTRAGSQVASRLLEHGYTCRVVRGDAAPAVVSKHAFDAVVLEIPLDDARINQGSERIHLVAGFRGPLILTSRAVLKLDLLRGPPRPHAVLTKPYFVEVLVQSIEAARGSTELGPKHASGGSGGHEAAADSKPDAPASGGAPRADRRVEVRHELEVNLVRVALHGTPDGQTGRGRLRNLSNSGGLLIDTATKLAVKTPVSAELVLLDGRTMLFTGRVMRAGNQDLAIKLETDGTQRSFLELYLNDALSAPQRTLQPVRINVVEHAASRGLLDDMALMRHWLEVSDKIENDELQQRFIQECLRAERLEFAVARYRDLKALRPHDERVAKYLLQIGTILSFYALQKRNLEVEQAKLPVYVKVGIGLFLVLVFGLLLILRRVLE